jgi:hypothetical protein
MGTTTLCATDRLPESIDGVPNISRSESAIAEVMAGQGPFYSPDSGIDFGRVRSCFANALHMHQPLIPAGSPDLGIAPIISNFAIYAGFWQ